MSGGTELIASVTAFVAAADAENAADDAQIAALQAQAAGLQQQIDELTADDAADAGQIASLQGQLITLNQQIAALQANDASDAAQIASLQAQVAALQEQMAENEENTLDLGDLSITVTTDDATFVLPDGSSVTRPLDSFGEVKMRICLGVQAACGAASGGGDQPEWVPEDAYIHIDLVGGDPQGRAWVRGTGVVAVDTLLGSDTNADDGWSAETEYDPLNLAVGGYTGEVAAIGPLRTVLMAGCTGVVRFSPGGEAAAAVWVSDAGSMSLEIAYPVATTKARAAVGWSGASALTGDIINTLQDTAISFTVTPPTSPRFEISANGGAAVTVTVLDEDWFVEGEDSGIIAFLVQAFNALQFITIYDPLPSTAGLSELSEVA